MATSKRTPTPSALLAQAKPKKLTTQEQKVLGELMGTIGSMTDQLITMRAEKAELQAKIDAIEKNYDLIATSLMDRLEAEGTDKGAGKLGTCSVTSSVVPNVAPQVGWEQIEKYVLKSGHIHLYQRRLSPDAWREVCTVLGKPVPGTTPVTVKRLNLRSK